MELGGVAYRRNVEFIRKFFRDTPTATVREAMREASQKRHGLRWDEVSRIHRELLPELRAAQAAAEPLEPVAEAAAPPQATPQQGETVPPRKSTVPLLDVPEAEREAGREHHGQGPAIRRRYLNSYLDAYPEATGEQCREALLATFGTAITLGYIHETIRLARATREAPPVPTPQPPAPALEVAPPPSPAPLAAPTAPVAAAEPPPSRHTLDDALRALAGHFRALCEEYQLSDASLALGPQRNVKVLYSRLERSSLEV